MRTTLLFLTAILMSTAAYAGFGEIGGQVTDAQTGDPMPGAYVKLFVGESMIKATSTDLDGYYTLNPVEVGTYRVEVSFIGMATQKIEGVKVSNGQTLTMNFKMSVDVMQVVEVSGYKTLVNPGYAGTVTMIDSKTIETSAADPVDVIAVTSSKAYQSDSGEPIQFNGARVNATAYMVDGVRIRDVPYIIRNSIDEMLVLTGGVPAKYGDFTGGIIVIETKSYKLGKE